MKRNAPLTIVEDLPWDAPAGATRYDRNAAGEIVSMQFGCPCGCGAHYGASFHPGRWGFSGTPEKPTVTPSLGCYPTGNRAGALGPDGVYHWHGYLKAGVYEEC